MRPEAQTSLGTRKRRDTNLSFAAVWKLSELARKDI